MFFHYFKRYRAVTTRRSPSPWSATAASTNTLCALLGPLCCSRANSCRFTARLRPGRSKAAAMAPPIEDQPVEMHAVAFDQGVFPIVVSPPGSPLEHPVVYPIVHHLAGWQPQ